jgi:hypothetical protein
MMEEGKGVSMAILGIVAVVSVVGLVMLFTGATANVAAPAQKIYGGALQGEEFPYLVERTTGGFPSTGGNPDAIYYDEGFAGSEGAGLIKTQDEAGFFGETVATERETYGRQPYYVPSGQKCAGGPDEPGFRCPQGTTCISNPNIAESGNWIQVTGPCYIRADSGR